MPAKSGQLVLTAAPQRLSNAYGGASLGNAVGGTGPSSPAAQDLSYKQVTVYAEAAAAYIGGGDTLAAGAGQLSTTNYGITIASGASYTFGPFDDGPIKLSDIIVLGNGCTLHFLGVPL